MRLLALAIQHGGNHANINLHENTRPPHSGGVEEGGTGRGDVSRQCLRPWAARWNRLLRIGADDLYVIADLRMRRPGRGVDERGRGGRDHHSGDSPPVAETMGRSREDVRDYRGGA